MTIRPLALVAVLALGCSGPPTTPASVTPTATAGSGSSLQALAASLCASTSYEGCVAGVLAAEAFGSGSVVAICDYGNGTGEVLWIEVEDDAGVRCSRGGLIAGSKVVATFRVP